MTTEPTSSTAAGATTSSATTSSATTSLATRLARCRVDVQRLRTKLEASSIDRRAATPVSAPGVASGLPARPVSALPLLEAQIAELAKRLEVTPESVPEAKALVAAVAAEAAQLRAAVMVAVAQELCSAEHRTATRTDLESRHDADLD